MCSQMNAAKARKFVGRICPKCRQGVIEYELADHDPMAGNKVELRCSRKNPCGFKVEVVPDK